MTCAEHLIENAIIALAKNKSFDNDINAESTCCTTEEAYEMAQHVVYSLYDGKFPEGLYSLKDCQLRCLQNEKEAIPKKYLETERLLKLLEDKISDYKDMVRYESKHGSVSDIEKAKAKAEAAKEIYGLIMFQSTVDTQKIKYSKWDYIATHDCFSCSSCKFESDVATDYCGGCGAVMNKESKKEKKQ